MKKIYFFFAFILSISVYSQSVIYSYSFEDDGANDYTTSITEFSDGGYDFFTSTFNNSIGSNYGVTGQDGVNYFAAQDTDDPGKGGSSDPLTLTFTIDISGYSNLGLKILVAEDDYGDPKWDSNDSVHIDYTIDGGTSTPLIWIESEAASGTNAETRIDTDFDGVGDGAAITEAFMELQQSITGTGSTLVLTITYSNLHYGSEDLAIDNIRIFEGFSASPTLLTSTNSISGFNYIEGSGPSSEKTFTVSGSDLTGDISIVPSNNFEISTTTGDNFTQNPLVLSPTDGSVASTSIYVRMISGLTAGDISSSVSITSDGADQSSIDLSGTVYFVPSQDLFISEYAEGSSNNKYVEIYNPLNSAVDLSNYSLKGSNNGSGWIAKRDFALTGTLNPAETLIVCANQADASILALTAAEFQLAYESPVHYNGDDAIGLFKGSNLIDIIGDPNSDPGSSWSVGTSGSTQDRTLVRKMSVTQGNLVWSTSAGTTDENSEWFVLAKDTWAFAGSHPHSEQALSIFDFDNQVVKVYPNPVETTLNFSGLNVPVQATVFDMLGKLHIQSEVTNSLDVSALKSGLYMIEIKNETSSKVFKMLKQ